MIQQRGICYAKKGKYDAGVTHTEEKQEQDAVTEQEYGPNDINMMFLFQMSITTKEEEDTSCK